MRWWFSFKTVSGDVEWSFKMDIDVLDCFEERFYFIAEYRNVLKKWDTQRIGTSLKIVKIIILADPKYWTILRKRKNIRNFSDPKNWDSVFVAPK